MFDYFLFEAYYRGGFEEIKKRKSIFLKYFIEREDVLDIGCGRGEFLSLLKEHGIKARGIDLDDDMIVYCRNEGLDVKKADLFTYLEKEVKDNSLGGIFMGQVIEHLPPQGLLRMLSLTYNKLKKNCYIVMTTPNPLNLLVGAANFYMDLTHVRPLHPETLKFVVESANFKEVDVIFFSPVDENARLKKIPLSQISNDSKNGFEIINENIDKLNRILFVEQDYAVVGRK